MDNFLLETGIKPKPQARATQVSRDMTQKRPAQVSRLFYKTHNVCSFETRPSRSRAFTVTLDSWRDKGA